MSKRFWLKLGEHFFTEEEIPYLESLPGGEKYICVWLKLLLKALHADDESECGILRFNADLPYSPELLSRAIGCEMDTLRVALDLFQKLRMIRIADDGTIYIDRVQKLVGKAADSTERVQRFRERQKLLQALPSNGGNGYCNDNIEKSRVEVEKSREDEDTVGHPSSAKAAERVQFDVSQACFLGISDELVARWKDTYPACDIDRELRKMREWILAHQSDGKGRKKNWLRFITNWLSRAQDRGGTR